MADVRRDKEGKPIRATRKTKGPKILATLSPEEVTEYLERRMLVVQKNRELLAVGHYVDTMTTELVEKYNLPTHFDLDFETGQVKEITS